eukprot:1652880-Rhodomonas_salina.1
MRTLTYTFRVSCCEKPYLPSTDFGLCHHDRRGGDPASLLSKVDVCIVPGELEPDLQGLAPDGWNVDCIAIREA